MSRPHFGKSRTCRTQWLQWATGKHEHTLVVRQVNHNHILLLLLGWAHDVGEHAETPLRNAASARHALLRWCCRMAIENGIAPLRCPSKPRLFGHIHVSATQPLGHVYPSSPALLTNASSLSARPTRVSVTPYLSVLPGTEPASSGHFPAVSAWSWLTCLGCLMHSPHLTPRPSPHSCLLMSPCP